MLCRKLNPVRCLLDSFTPMPDARFESTEWPIRDFGMGGATRLSLRCECDELLSIGTSPRPPRKFRFTENIPHERPDLIMCRLLVGRYPPLRSGSLRSSPRRRLNAVLRFAPARTAALWSSDLGLRCSESPTKIRTPLWQPLASKRPPFPEQFSCSFPECRISDAQPLHKGIPSDGTRFCSTSSRSA